MRIVKTKTPDNLHLTGFLSQPSVQKKTAVVHVHGMGGGSYTNAWYPHFHKLFPKNDIAFLVGNNRGTGSITMFYREPNEYPNYGNSFEVFEECVYEIDAWVKYTKELGYQDVYLSAHSLGPSKVVYYMNQAPDESVRGLILLSPVDMLGISMAENEGFNEMTQKAKDLVGQGKEDQLLVHGSQPRLA